MSFVDLLDSAKSAYPKKDNNEWWRVSSKDEQVNSISLAKTEMMLRILHGETIQLSNNQMFDSVAFLNSAKELTRLSFLERPPFAFAYFDRKVSKLKTRSDISPYALVELSLGFLENRDFIFSAWPELENDIYIRNKMIEGIQKSEDNTEFSSMIKEIYLDIDQSLREIYKNQAESLQLIYNYLRKQHEKGNVVVRSVPSSNRTIWSAFDELKFRGSRGIAEVIKWLEDQIIEKKLTQQREDRSLLYHLIQGLEPSLRRDFRDHIDIYYNQKIGASVSPRGRGTYSLTSHNIYDNVISKEGVLENADIIYSPHGVVSEEAMTVLSKRPATLDMLTWKDVEQVLSEEKPLRDSANNLQFHLSLYENINPDEPNYHNKINEWQKITDESLEKHHTLLSSLLGSKIHYSSSNRRLLLFAAQSIGIAGGTFIGTCVAALCNNMLASAITAAATETFTNLTSLLMEHTIEKDLRASTITKVREDLRHTVKFSTNKRT